MKVALILSVAIVLATTITVSALIYFSPYQSCVRAVMEVQGEQRRLDLRLLRTAALSCARSP